MGKGVEVGVNNCVFYRCPPEGLLLDAEPGPMGRHPCGGKASIECCKLLLLLLLFNSLNCFMLYMLTLCAGIKLV